MLYGIDLEFADPFLCSEFDRIHSLRLILWDAYVNKKQAEAMESGRSGVPDQHPALVIPEYQN